MCPPFYADYVLMCRFVTRYAIACKNSMLFCAEAEVVALLTPAVHLLLAQLRFIIKFLKTRQIQGVALYIAYIYVYIAAKNRKNHN